MAVLATPGAYRFSRPPFFVPILLRPPFEDPAWVIIMPEDVSPGPHILIVRWQIRADVVVCEGPATCRLGSGLQGDTDVTVAR